MGIRGQLWDSLLLAYVAPYLIDYFHALPAKAERAWSMHTRHTHVGVGVGLALMRHREPEHWRFIFHQSAV